MTGRGTCDSFYWAFILLYLYLWLCCRPEFSATIFSQVYVETIALQIDKVSYGLLEISQHSFNPWYFIYKYCTDLWQPFSSSISCIYYVWWRPPVQLEKVVLVCQQHTFLSGLSLEAPVPHRTGCRYLSKCSPAQAGQLLHDSHPLFRPSLQVSCEPPLVVGHISQLSLASLALGMGSAWSEPSLEKL